MSDWKSWSTSAGEQASKKAWDGKWLSLEVISEGYVVIAKLNAIGVGLLCVYLFFEQEFKILIYTAIYGVISTLTRV